MDESVLETLATRARLDAKKSEDCLKAFSESFDAQFNGRLRACLAPLKDLPKNLQQSWCLSAMTQVLGKLAHELNLEDPDIERANVVTEFGRTLRELRQFKNLTKHEVATRSFIDPDRYRKIDQGLADPTALELFRIASGLDMAASTLAELFENRLSREGSDERRS